MRSPEPGGRPRILIVSEALDGGVLRHFEYLLRYMPRDRFDVHLAVSLGRSPIASEHVRRWRQAGWPVHEVPMRRHLAPGRDLKAFVRLLALCRRGRYAIVHSHSAKAGFLGRLVGRLTGARTVHTPHVFPFDRGISHRPERFYLALERIAAGWTDSMVLLSRYQVDLVLRRRLLPPERIAVIANGVDPPDAALPDRRAARRALGLPEEEAVVLTLGRLCRQKGQDVLIDAAGLAARQADAAFRLLIVGEGPIRRTLEARVRTRGLNGLVSLPGATAHPELYYAACDLVAMPSRFEGMPYVLLEARAAGRPVAASLCSGMEEFIEHGRDGFLLPVGDREAWAGVLLRASRSRGEMREMGERAGSRLRPEWGAPKSVARLVDVYEGLLKARKGGAQSQGCQPGSD